MVDTCEVLEYITHHAFQCLAFTLGLAVVVVMCLTHGRSPEVATNVLGT